MTISSVTFIASDLIRLDLSFSARIDSDYTDPANYFILPNPGSTITGDAVAVQRVIVPSNDAVVAPYVYLNTTPHTPGAEYQAAYGKLYNSSGALVPCTANIPYASRTTKTMQMLKSIPSHFDHQVTSVIRNLITAISLEDDTIGGSRKDEFP